MRLYAYRTSCWTVQFHLLQLRPWGTAAHPCATGAVCGQILAGTGNARDQSWLSRTWDAPDHATGCATPSNSPWGVAWLLWYL